MAEPTLRVPSLIWPACALVMSIAMAAAAVATETTGDRTVAFTMFAPLAAVNLIMGGFVIVARVRSRHALRLLVETADLLRASTGVVIFEAERPGLIVSVSGPTEELLGLRPGDLEGRTLRDLRFSPDLLPPARVGISREAYQMEHADGRLRHVDIVCRAISDSQLRGVILDTEHRYLFERAADEAESRMVEEDGSALKALLDTVQNGIVLMSGEGEVTLASPAVTQLVGAPDSDSELLDLLDYVQADDRAKLAELVRMVVDGQTPSARRDIRLVRADESVREVVAFVSPYHIHGEIAGALVELSDATEERVANREISRLAQFDHLTNLPNRLHFEGLVRDAALNARRSNDNFAVMLIDLDRFKIVNDTLGHSIGDQLLIQLAERLTALLPDRVVVGRFGGDEFLVLTPSVGSPEELSTIADDIQDILSGEYIIDGHELRVAGSVGISIFPYDGDDFETLVRHADTAMYRAKRRGGHTHHFANPEHDAELRDQLALEAALRRGLAQDEFVVHYQPQFTIAPDELRGFEALLRWERPPPRGLTQPDRFVSTLEDSGLIVDVGEFVLRSACESMVQWQREGLQPVPIAVNVAARQLVTAGFVEMVRRVLDESGLAPEYLELEVTETMAIENLDEAREALFQLRAEGVLVAMDDFGTGHSSLARLTTLPFDLLKLDRSFVDDLSTDEGQAIAAGVIALAHAIGLPVLAEGVETEEQLRKLRSYECDAVQGFLFSRALERDEVVRRFVTAQTGARHSSRNAPALPVSAA